MMMEEKKQQPVAADSSTGQGKESLSSLKTQAVQAVNEQELIDKSCFTSDKDEQTQEAFKKSWDRLEKYEVAAVDSSEQKTLSRKQKSSIWTLRGRALIYAGGAQNFKKAEDYLQKVVKVSPNQTAAWNALAHLEWSRKELVKAKNYLQTSIERNDANKESLRMLSMLMRQIPQTTDELKQESSKYSLQLAHKAVSLDIADSESWYILGTAYIQNFFINEPKLEELDKAIKAYKQSEKTMKWKNPDLFCNRATIYAFLELYGEAIDDLNRAYGIEKNQNYLNIAKEIIQHTHMMHLYVTGKTKLKQIEKNKDKQWKFTKDIVSQIQPWMKQEIFPIIKAAQTENFKPDSVKIVKLLDIKMEGCFTGIFSCRIIKHIKKYYEIPVCYLAIDSDGKVFCLSLYNTSIQKLQDMKYGSEVVIARPVAMSIQAGQTDFEKLYYPCVRVTNLGYIWCNQRPLNDRVVVSQVTTSTFPEQKEK